MSLPYPISSQIDVYQDDPKWDQHTKWFMLPMHVLKELFVCRYELPVDEDGDYCGDWKQDSEFLLNKHPSCVFVYCSNS